MHDFAALATVSAAYDERMAQVVRQILADDPTDGMFADLASRVGRFA